MADWLLKFNTIFVGSSLLVLFMAAVVLYGFAPQLTYSGAATSVVASDATTTGIARFFSADPVPSGDVLQVTLDVSIVDDHFYALEEEVPDGFLIIDAGSAHVVGQTLKWFSADRAALSSEQLTYTLIAPSVATTTDYIFSGSFISESTPTSAPVGGLALLSVQGQDGVSTCDDVTYLMDYNSNGDIDMNDLLRFTHYYLGDDLRADVDGDGVVTAGDYSCIDAYSNDIYAFPPTNDECVLECESYVPYCGDGHADVGEHCDGNDFNGKTCGGGNRGSGVLTCTDACRIDRSSCKKDAGGDDIPERI